MYYSFLLVNSLQKTMCAISSNPSKPKKTLRNPGLKEGQPLPGNGTCKHYKKSYRWLRSVTVL